MARSLVDSPGTHGLSCRSSADRSSRHAQINDLVWRLLSRASIPSVKEPRGMVASDERRPDGCTLIPWKKSKCLAWDATVADTFAPTYLAARSVKAGSAAEILSAKKLRNTGHSRILMFSLRLRPKLWGRSMKVVSNY